MEGPGGGQRRAACCLEKYFHTLERVLLRIITYSRRSSQRGRAPRTGRISQHTLRRMGLALRARMLALKHAGDGSESRACCRCVCRLTTSPSCVSTCCCHGFATTNGWRRCDVTTTMDERWVGER